MKKKLTILFLFLNLFMFSQTYYKGLERMCQKDKNGKTNCYDSPRKWYHENTLLLTNDSVFIYKTPIQIEGKRKLYSASDGGFEYYFGKLETKSKGIIAYLTMYNCDYCATKIKIDTITGYYYPIPKKDTLKFSKKLNEITLGSVKYKKTVKNKKNDFPSKKRFYFDSTSIYRKNPMKQYSLINKSIEDFYKTKNLKLQNETLIICTEREDEFGKTLELLEPEKIKLSISGVKIVFYTKSELENLISNSKTILRYILIGEVREDIIYASVDLSYRKLPAKEIKDFDYDAINDFFVYKKIKSDYQLINGITKNNLEIEK